MNLMKRHYTLSIIMTILKRSAILPGLELSIILLLMILIGIPTIHQAGVLVGAWDLEGLAVFALTGIIHISVAGMIRGTLLDMVEVTMVVATTEVVIMVAVIMVAVIMVAVIMVAVIMVAVFGAELLITVKDFMGDKTTPGQVARILSDTAVGAGAQLWVRLRQL